MKNLEHKTYKKIIGVPLEKDASSGKQEDGSFIVKGKFTSDNPDALGDIITRKATENAIPAYRQWGNIRYMHQPRPVGKVLRIGKEDGLKWNEVEIKVIDPSAVFEVEQGLLTALSVGILIKWEDIEVDEDTGGWKINDYSLAEISLVDHPANYDAKLQFSIDDTLRTMAREVGSDNVAASLLRLLEQEDNMPTEENEILVEEKAQDITDIEEELHTETEEVELSASPTSEETPVLEQEEEVVELSLESDEVSQPEEVVENTFTLESLALALQEQTEQIKALTALVTEFITGASEASDESIEDNEEGVELELGLPVTDRDSAVPVEEVVTEDDTPKAPVVERDPRSVLRAYLQNKNKIK